MMIRNGQRPFKGAAFRAMNRGNITVLSIIFIVTVVVYSNSINNDFTFDDNIIITKNNNIRQLGDLKALFLTNYWGESAPQDPLYRPITTLSYAINYHFSQLNPRNYHLTNILLHTLNSLLVYKIGVRLNIPSGPAFFIALLFAIHPIHTEPVNGIVGRADLLAFFFSLLAFLCYPGWHFFSLLFYLLALFSKEHAIAFPIVLLCYCLCFRSVRFKNLSLFPMLYGLKGYMALTLAYLVWKKIVISSIFLSGAEINFIDNPLAQAPIIPRVLTGIKILGLYLKLQLLPFWLSADYSYNQVPIVYSPFDLNLIAPVFLHALIFGGGGFFLHRNPAAVFCLLYYFVTILFVSNLFFPIGTIMAERLLYLPSFGSIGFLVLLGYSWIDYFPDRDKPLSIENPNYSSMNWKCISMFFAAIGIIITSSVRTYMRNYDWRDDFTLFSHSATTSPNSIKVRQNLGVQYFKQKRYLEAKNEFLRAISIKPDASEPYNYLGICEIELGEQKKGIAFIKKAIQLNPKNYSAYNNLALVYKKMGLLKESMELYQKSLYLNPKNSTVRLNLANAYLQQGQLEQALNQYREVLRQQPYHKEVHYKLGKLYLIKGFKEKARQEFEAELEINPGYTLARDELVKLK